MPELALVSDAVLPDRTRAMRGAAIAGIGTATPARALANGPIAERLGVDERWIIERTGVRERRIASPAETVSSLAASAASEALSAAGVAVSDVDLIVVATMSHERLTPSAAALVAEQIGARGAGAVDLNAACSGFVTGLAFATGLVESGRAGIVVLVGADVLSPITDPHDRRTAALFGDGAGAAVIVPAAAPGRIGPVVLGSDGARSELITAERREALIRMNGHDTFRQALARLAEATLAACGAAGVGIEEIDLFAFHQANARILVAVAERLDLDPARVINCIDRYGNTSAATVPIALTAALEQGSLAGGDRVLLAAFGGGLTWAATVVEWGGAQ